MLAAGLPSAANGDAEQSVDAESPPNDRAASLRAISQGLYREENQAFEQVETSWLAGGANELWAAADSIAVRLDEPAPRLRKSAS